MRDFLLIMKAHNYFVDSRWNRSDFTYTFETGSKIEFFGADQPDKVKGARRTRLFINEANNVPFGVFDQMEVRTSEFTFLDWNPSNEFWYHTEIVSKREDYEHLVLTYKDNEALEASVIAKIEARKNRPGWWRVYGEGLDGEVEGKIYNGWEIVDHVPVEARLERHGLDFGYTNDPTAIIDVYHWNGAYVFDEICYKTGMGNKMIADFLSLQPKALVIADSAEPKSIDEINSYPGLNVVGAVKGEGSISYGIDTIQDQNVFVTKRSINTIREYRNYLFLVDRNGKTLNTPEGGNDHAMDAIRYAMVSINPIKRQIMHKQLDKKREERDLLKQFDAHRAKTRGFAGIR